MSSEKELVCIVCPASCTLRVIVEGDEVKVDGAMCSRGVDFARREVTSPLRYVMSVVKVRNGEFPTASVITRKPVPKDCIWIVMDKLADIELEAPVEIGQIVVSDVCGTDVVATRRVRKAVREKASESGAIVF
ncbi:MAG: DUF1667 domain-containing protein [Desulfurococcaceae archaeon]